MKDDLEKLHVAIKELINEIVNRFTKTDARVINLDIEISKLRVRVNELEKNQRTNP